jgi:tetratricopeptide (TPR) repeat protein
MKLKIPLYLFVLLFCTFFLTGCTSKENVNLSNNLVGEGQELYKEREYKKATDKFTEALEIYPGNVDAYNGLTEIFLDKGYFNEAVKLADEASRRISKESVAEIYTAIGDKYYASSDFDDAKEMYKKGLENDGSKVGLAKVRILDEEFEEAKKALKGGNNHEEYHLLVAYLSLGDWEVGSEIINEVDLNKIENVIIKERVNNLREIYTIDDEDSLYKNVSLAGEYINAGLYPLALRIISEQGDKINEYGDAQYFLGRAYLDAGEYIKAIESTQSAILLDTDSPEVYVTLARAYVAERDMEKGFDAYKQALAKSKDGDGEIAVWEYVEVLIENKMINVAKNVVLDLLKDKNHVNTNMVLAEIYYQQKDLVGMNRVLLDLEARTDLTQSETKDLTKYRLLYSLEDINDVGEIENLIERYSVFDRYNPEVYLFKARLFINEDKNLEAKEALERAIELDLDGNVADKAVKLLAALD